MKQFSCGDVVPGCSAKFQGRDEADLFDQIARHAREDHGLTDLPADLVEAVKKNIHPTRHA
jgi:predicted small metal-binding protein